MSDTLKLALEISAVDMFGGVLNRFRDKVTGMGRDAEKVQRDYTRMVNNIQAGLKSLAVSKYGLDKIKPAVKDAADFQESLLEVKEILQGAHPNAKKLADQMERVRNNSIEVAKHMKYSAIEVTRVTKELLKGGVPLQAILGKRGAAWAVEGMAEVQNQSPAYVAEQVANIGHAYQLKPSQYGGAVNLILQASSTASGDLQDMFRDISQVGGIAHMAGRTDLRATLAAIKALAPLGQQAGSDLAQMMTSILNPKGGKARRAERELGLSFYDKKGNFVGLDAAIERLRKALAKLPTQQKRQMALGDILQQTGIKAADLLLLPAKNGAKSYEEIKNSIAKQASLQQRIKVREEGLNMNLAELSSTTHTTIATLFTPMLGPLTEAVKLTNKLVGDIGELSTKHIDLSRTISWGSAGLVAGAGLYGAGRLLAGVIPGSRLLKSILGGAGKTAAGIAEGKAIQTATGVSPVFVTNWPAGFGNASNRTESEARKAAKTAGRSGLWNLGGKVAGYGLLAGGAYYVADSVYHKFTHEVGLMSMTHKTARRQIQDSVAWQDRVLRGIEGGISDVESWFHWGGGRREGQINGKIAIEIDANSRALVKEMKSDNPGVEFDVGHLMQVP